MKLLSLSVCIALAFCLCVQGAFAAPTPSDTVKSCISIVLDTLKNPAYADPKTRPPLHKKIEMAVEKAFDFSEFSARTVGAKWKTFSSEQKTDFTEAFKNLLLVTYLDNIEGYNGESVEYTGEKMSEKGNRAEVSSLVTLEDGKKAPVNYRLMEKKGSWVVYDIIIENVSLIKNYRAQFKEILLKGTPEQLIEKVIERTKTLAKAK